MKKEHLYIGLALVAVVSFGLYMQHKSSSKKEVVDKGAKTAPTDKGAKTTPPVTAKA